jgi:hypothetical protein
MSVVAAEAWAIPVTVATGGRYVKEYKKRWPFPTTAPNLCPVRLKRMLQKEGIKKSGLFRGHEKNKVEDFTA